MWQSLETFLVTFVCLREENVNGQWVEARDAAKHPTVLRTAPPHPQQKSILTLDVHSTETETLCFKNRDVINWEIHLCGPSQLLLMWEKEPSLHLICHILYMHSRHLDPHNNLRES